VRDQKEINNRTRHRKGHSHRTLPTDKSRHRVVSSSRCLHLESLSINTMSPTRWKGRIILWLPLTFYERAQPEAQVLMY